MRFLHTLQLCLWILAGTVSRLRDEHSGFPIPVAARHFTLLEIVQTDCGTPNSVLSRVKGGRGVILITHLHPVLRFRISRAKPALPYSPSWL